jgi:hypothetical protein
LYIDSDTHKWREVVEEAGPEIDELRVTAHTIDFPAWRRRTGCAGESTRRVEALWGDRVADGRLTLHKIVIEAVR